MALTVVEEGPRNLVIKVLGIGPYTINVGTLNPPCAELVLMHAMHAIPGVDVITIDSEATVNQREAQYNSYTDTHCYKRFGGLQNTAGDGKTGNVIIGCPAEGFAVLTFRKVRPVISS